jgi:hypothetical protein
MKRNVRESLFGAQVDWRHTEILQIAEQAHDPARGHSLANERKNFLVKPEGFGFVGIDQVDQLHVERAGIAGQVLDHVLNPNLGSGIVEASAMKTRKVISASLDDELVELHNHYLLHAWIAQHFPECEAVATSVNENPLRVFVKEKGWKREVLVIDELVPLEELDQPV